MNVSADGMTGSVGKEFSVSGAGDRIAGGFVYFPADNLAAACDSAPNFLKAGITGGAHVIKNLLLTVAGRSAHDTRPGDVIKNRVGMIRLGPHIDQHKIAFADGS